MEEKEYSVSEAVRLIGVESHVLRYWEDELRIEVRRNAQGHRIYSEDNIRLFRKVRELKEKGLQLKAIRLLLEGQERQTPGESARDARLVEQILGLAGMGELCGVADKPERGMEEPGGTTDKPERGMKEPGGAADDSKTLSGEIVPVSEPEPLQQFERILRRLIEEVVSEQNGKLEEAIAGRMRDELDDFCLQYGQMLREAAVSLAPESGGGGRLRRLLRRLFGGR